MGKKKGEKSLAPLQFMFLHCLLVLHWIHYEAEKNNWSLSLMGSNQYIVWKNKSACFDH